MTQETVRISELIIPKFWAPFNDTQHTHKILTSGRAGTKSSAAAIEAVFKVIQDIDGSVVVIRKRHNKLRKTVYKEIKRAMKRLHLDERLFKITVSPMEIRYLENGNTIYFTGSDNIDDTKGIIDEEKPIRLVVLDEIDEFFDQGEGEDELQNIEATFIRGNDEGFQMLYLFNPPKNPNAAVVTWMRRMERRPDALHVHVDYRDVPPEWLGRKLLESAEILRQTDERQWRWLWLGQSIGVDELIYYMFNDRHRRLPGQEHYRIIAVGGDYGQQNATTFQAFGLDEYRHRLEGLGEFFHSGRDTGHQKSPSEYAEALEALLDDLDNTFRPGGSIHSVFYVFLDPSAQGLKEEVRRRIRSKPYQVLLRDAENDVRTGISRVQTLLTFDRLSIAPQQENALREFRTYEYDKKSIERGAEVPVKKDDHCMDAIRYAVMGMWSRLKTYLPTTEREEEYTPKIYKDEDA